MRKPDANPGRRILPRVEAGAGEPAVVLGAQGPSPGHGPAYDVALPSLMRLMRS